ncbi:hypothetical protein [Pedobacter sp. L105]|uniref:hypothetical protein n=1 Tax=Pedobacter sp. L105 TaxID=1641871 RepID=UPI00131C3021|nr:hypothetical protein [Pedobacter sp. L105]
MEKSQIKILKTFKLKQQTAIDVFDSFYSYEDVKFFVELIPDLMLKNNYSNINQKDHANLGWLIKNMTRLIDSDEMTELLQKFSNTESVKMKPDIPLINNIGIANRLEIFSDQMLEWLNCLPAHQKRKIYTMEEMKDFFISVFFFNEFIKWLDQVITDKDTTLVELLDSYYSWFPSMPRLKKPNESS